MMESTQAAVRVSVLREPEAEGLPLPAYATAGAAGLICAPRFRRSCRWYCRGRAGGRDHGAAAPVAAGYEGQVRPRSGFAARYCIGILNAPGTIDSDYTGVVKVILINWGDAPYTIRRGDRIAQLVVAPVTRVQLVEANALEATERGDGGFGSTGDGETSVAGE